MVKRGDVFGGAADVGKQRLRRFFGDGGGHVKDAAVYRGGELTAHHVEMFLHFGEHRADLVRHFALAAVARVALRRFFQLVGQADVIDHQPAVVTAFVFEDAVYPRYRLHQVVPLHGFVEVHGVAAGRIEAGVPHIAHDDHLQRVVRVFEALFQCLFLFAAVEVRLEFGRVARRTSHDDFNRAAVHIVAVPLRTQGDDVVV